MNDEPIDRVPDQLLTPLMAFLSVAINATVGQVTLDAAGEAVNAVSETLIRPQNLALDPEGATRLSCYRLRSKPKRVSFGHIDHVATVQFDYVTPACGAEQLEERWPILDRVWGALIDAIDAGSHPDWEDGASVHAAAGITWLDLNTAEKQEFYVDGNGFTYPGFRGQLQVTWRNHQASDTEPTYPALSFTSKIYQGDPHGDAPDAVSIGYTALGQIERDTDTIEETGEAIL
jgi:hypothetical protein